MQADLKNWFTYHAPKADQPERYQEIRVAALALAETIDRCCPDCADKTATFRKLRETVMSANQTIACNE